MNAFSSRVASPPYRITTIVCAITCALAPAYVVRWHIGAYPTTLLEIAIAVSVVAFAVEYFRNSRLLVWRTPLLWPAALFLVAGAISVVTAPSITAAAGLYRAYLIEPIAFGLVLVNVLRTSDRAFVVAAGLAAGAGAAGIANSAVVLNGLLQHTYNVAETPPVVIYSTANAVALFEGPVVALAIGLAVHGTRPYERWAGAVFAALGVIVVALSFSRGGYIALAAVVVAAAVSHRRRWILLGAAAVAFAVFAAVPPIFRRIDIELHNVYGNTVQSRIDLWTAAIKLLEHRPVFGAGLSGFQERAAPYYTHLHTQANFIDPHNIVLNFWVETGLLGLIAFVWITFVAVQISWRGWTSSAMNWRPYHLGVLLALIAVVVHGMVDVPYFKNDLSLEFWTIVAISVAGVIWSRSEAERPTVPRDEKALVG
ncbi:MAG TPA: O-antigen ligase family protein [Candidatus Dormibacteraeota bacterium]|nr:O-antigen ligase family protein [Candidatus Dormibacteraeota bacterium]